MVEQIQNMEEGQQVDQVEQTEQTTQDQKPQPPKAHKLYDNLISDGYTTSNLGSKEEFAKAMSDKTKADKFYNTLIKEGYTVDNIGSKNEFVQSLSQKKNDGQTGSNGTSPTKSQSLSKETPKNPEPSIIKSPKEMGIDVSKNFYTRNNADATYLSKNVTGEKLEQFEKHKKDLSLAIDNTTDRALKNKGLTVSKNSPTYIKQRKKVEDAVKNGDATYSIDPLTKTPALSQTTGFFESAWNALKSSVNDEDEADSFMDMNTEERIKYAEDRLKKIQPTEEGYIGEKPGGVTGKAGELLGGLVPFATKMTAGTLAGGALIAAAPETAGASLAGLPAVVAFATTAPSMINQGGRDEVIRRYDIYKKENPNVSDIDAMKEAEKGLVNGEIAGGLTNLLFTSVGAKPIAEEARLTLGKYLNNALKSATHMGATVTSVKAGQEIAAGFEDKKLKETLKEGINNAVDNFTSNFTVGGALHILTSLPTLPGAVKSSVKYALSKENPLELAKILNNNEQLGNIPQGTTEKVMSDISDYNKSLNKTSTDLSPETQASVAGLIQKRDNLMSEMASKDATQIDSYLQQVDGLNEQIKKITESNDPFAHEVNDLGQKINGEISDEPLQKGVEGEPKAELPKQEKGVEEVIPKEQLDKTQSIIDRIGKNESINEGEMKEAEDILYNALADNPESAHLIEPLILKLQNHENITKTETVQTTERKPVEGAFAAKQKITIKPALEQSEGSTATVTLADGTTHTGNLRIKDGNYVLDVEGQEPVIIGEKQITDRDLKVPEGESPVELDENGNVKSATFETKDGHKVTITDPEKALDLGIQLSLETVGEIPDEAFDKVYEDVVKEDKIEVPIEKPKKAEAEEKQQAEIPKEDKPEEELPEQKEKKERENTQSKLKSLSDEQFDNLKKNAEYGARENVTDESLANDYHDALKVPEPERTEKQNKIVEAVNKELKTKKRGKVTKAAKGKAAKFVAEHIEETTPEGEGEAKPEPSTEEKTGEEILKELESKGTKSSDEKSLNELAEKNKGNKVKAKIIEQARKAIKTLKSIFPNMDIHLHESEQDYNDVMEKIGAKKSSGGNFAILKNADGSYSGRIDINLNEANNRTISHEVTHAILSKVFGENQQLFQSFRNKISKVLSNATDAELKKFADSQFYKEKGVSAEEYLSEMSGLLSSKTINPLTLSKIASAINEFVSKLTNGKFIPFENVNDAKDVIDFFNKVSTAIKSGSDLTNIGKEKILETPEQKNNIIKNRMQAWGAFEKLGFEETEDFKKLVESGHIVKDYDLSEMAGKPVFIINPDNMLVGSVKIGDKIIAEGKGGIHFVSDTGDVWAFSDTIRGKVNANKMAEFINTQLKENGVANIILSKGDLGKLFSSHAGARGAMRVLEALVDKKIISKIDFRNALKEVSMMKDIEGAREELDNLIKQRDDAKNKNRNFDVKKEERINDLQKNIESAANRKYNINFTGIKSETIHNDVESQFFNKSDNTFSNRGTFVTDIIEHLAKNGEFSKEQINKLRQYLNSKELPASTERKTGNIDFSLKSIKDAVGLLFSDEATVGGQNSDAYAVIKVENPKFPVEMVKGAHESYGAHLRQVVKNIPLNDFLKENKNLQKEDLIINDKKEVVGIRPKLLLLSEKNHIADVVNNKNNEPTVANKLGSNTIGLAEGVVKSKNDFPEPKIKSKSQIQEEKELPLKSKEEKNARTEKERTAGEVKINSEKVQYNGTDAIGSRERTESEQNAARNEAKAKIKNPETNASLKAANSYNESVGLPEVTPHKYKPSDPVQQTKLAKLYPKLQDVNSPTYKETDVERRIYSEYKNSHPEIFKQYDIKDYKDLVHKSYDQLIKETQLQYDALPVKVTFHENGEGNYENNFEMLDDVHNFNHLWVYKGGDDHTELGNKTKDSEGLTANDKFRAVHDYYGHSVEGYQFGKDGEENAWIEHSKMFSPLAQWALSAETRGQNSWVNYSGVNDATLEAIKTASALKKEGKRLGNQEMIDEAESLLGKVYDDFQFAEQKAIILPPEYSDVSKFHTNKISEVPEQLQKGVGEAKAEIISKSQMPIDKKISDMKDILKEYVDEGKSLEEIKDILKDEFGDYYKDVEGIIDQAHQEMTTTSIKNAVTERERGERGLAEVEVEAKRSFGKVFDTANEMIANNEINGLALAAEVVKNPRPLKAEESAVLLIDRMRISNEYNKRNAELLEAQEKGETDKADIIQSQMEALEEQMDLNDEAAKKSGYEQGLGLAARRMLIAQDYSLVTQMNRLKAANGGKEVPKEYQEQLKNLVAKLEEANKKLEKFEKTQAGTKKQSELDKTRVVVRTPEDVAKAKESIKNKILNKWGKTLARMKERTNIGGKSQIVSKAAEVPMTPEKQSQLESIVKDVNDMVKLYAETGETKLSKIIDNIHQDLVGDIPDLTKSDVEDIVLGKYDVEKVKTPLTAEKIQAQADVRKVKTQIDLLKQELKYKQRNVLEKGMDYLHGWHRFAILSGFPSAGKISTAALSRGLVTRVENVVGQALSLIPGIRGIAKKAAREGRFSPSAEARAFRTWFEKMTHDDVREVMATGMSSIDYIYGKKEPKAPKVPEWMEFFGRMHSAIKLLPKQAEFFRSLEMRTEHALKQGKNVEDPMVQQELGAAAYNDALRAIYMQDNPLSDAYKNFVNKLDKTHPVFASGLKFMFPIVKVPVNYVAEQSSYLPPIAAIKALTTLGKGMKGMTGEQADYFMRALKKGSIGTAFIFMGFLNPQAVGGYYTGKRKKEDLEAGEIELFGTKLPHFMLHTPLLEMLQVGATLRRVQDAKLAKGEEASKFDGIPAVLKGEATQVPFVGTGERVTKLLDNKTSEGLKDFASSMAQSIIEPQIMQNIADWTDIQEGEMVKRKTSGLGEKLVEGVPLWRKTLKEEKSKLSNKEYEAYSNITDKGLNIPEINKKDSYRVKYDDKHPDKIMTDKEYDEFIPLVKEYAKKEYSHFYSANSSDINKLKKMIDAVPETSKEKSELNILKEKLQNKIDAAHNKAINKAKIKLHLK